MLDRRGLFTLAFGLTLLVVALLFGAYHIGSKIGETRGYRNYHASSYEAHAANEIRSTCLLGDGPNTAECISKVIHATNENKRAEKDLVAQTEMATWAFWMLIVTIFVAVVTAGGVYFVWRTLLATKKTVTITREIGEAQVRAYLTIESGTITPEIEDGERIVWKIHVGVRNCGQSPARKIKIKLTGPTFAAENLAVTRDLAAGESRCLNLIAATTKQPLQFVDSGETHVYMKATIVVSFLDVFAEPDGRTFVTSEFSGRVHLVDGVTSRLANLGDPAS